MPFFMFKLAYATFPERFVNTGFHVDGYAVLLFCEICMFNQYKMIMKSTILKKWLLPTLCCSALLFVSCSKDKDDPDGPVFPKTNVTQVKEYIEKVTADYSKQFQSELELANNVKFYIEMAEGMSKAFESSENELLNNMFKALKGLVKDRDITQLVNLKQIFPFDCYIELDERTEPPTGYAKTVRFVQSEDTIPDVVKDLMGRKRVLLYYYRKDSILVVTNLIMQFDPDVEDDLTGKSLPEQMELLCPKSVSISVSMYDKDELYIGDVLNAIIYPSVDSKLKTFKATSRIDFPNGRSLSFTDIVTNYSKNMNASLSIFGNSIFGCSYFEQGANQFDCLLGFKAKDEKVVMSSMASISLGSDLTFSFTNISDAGALDIMLPVLVSAFADHELSISEMKLLLNIEDPISYANIIHTYVLAPKLSFGYEAAAEISLVERTGGKVGLDLIAQDGSSCPISQVKFFGKDFSELFTYLMDTVKKLAEMGIMIQQSGFSSKIFDIFLK